MLSALPYLKEMGLVERDSVEVVYSRAGLSGAVRLPIVELERPPRDDRPFMSFAIDTTSDLAVLTLNSCRFDEEYRGKLREFFAEVSARGIGSVCLDVRRNPGGDSRVIDEFLRYIDIDTLKTYGSTVRYSRDARKQTKMLKFGVEEYPRTARKNEMIVGKDLLFSGSLYVLTSPNTFSSANMFAATIQDNRIGTIVGEPTGNQPSCCGHPLSFQMPRTGIYFKVSHKLFFRPDSTLDGIDAVYPDVEAYRTIDDIIAGRDAQMDTVRELIAAKLPPR
jgi:C-terminal processing protease CtpA/Prc